MKNPIKNGKEVFAVLSMATVMSISMSVKVNAASGAESKIDTAAASAAHAVVENVDNAPSANKVEETIAAKEDRASLEDTKKEDLLEDDKAIDPGSTGVTGENSASKADEVSGLEVAGDEKAESARPAEEQATQAETTQDKAAEENKEDKLELGEEREPQAQQAGETEVKAFELKNPTPVGVYDPKNLTEEEIENVKKAVVKANPDVKANSITVSNDGKVIFTDPDGKEQTLAPAETVVKDYSIDESKIKDFDESKRYRETQLEQGNGPVASFDNLDQENRFIDGYRYKTLEPGAASPDKKKWGYEIEIDKEKGQRTYTDFVFTNSGLLGGVLATGNIPAKSPEDGKLAEGFKDPNYKANTEVVIDKAGRQLNLNANATEEDLKYINNQDNKNIVMAWEGKYKVDNPNGLKATEGGSAAFNFTVNPWPNENDKLSLIKLQGEYKDKVFVQGQKVNTGVKVQNLDENAKKRLVGQVYNPNTGKVVPGAKAYIDENGIVQVEMPEGVINEDGTLNKDSVFYKDNDYKGIQSLDVKFFARPRTEAEFRAVGKEANYGEDKYTSTGAGTKTINHNGKDVEVDLQGIDRYDHYNLIGNLKLNLDDTRYYDQGFMDGNDKDTSKHTSSEVKPGEEFEVNLYVPEDKKDKDGNIDKELFPNQKSPEEMKAAKDAKQAIGTIDRKFIDKINEGKKEKDKWKLEYDESTLPTTFKITPPQSAKAGDFVAVPLTYTYTNGSTDTHWFHFVVQESTYIRPDYGTEVNFPSIEQSLPAKVADDPKRIAPDSYALPDTLPSDDQGNKIIKDAKGNDWAVSVDKKTGKVNAKPLVPTNFNGGEKLTVPVIAHYVDEQKPGEDITREVEAYFVIEERANMTPRYNAKAGKSGDELSSKVILNEEDKYNRRPTKFTIDSDTYEDDKGNKWHVTIDEKTGQVTATVPNAEEGKSIDGALLNVPVTAHYFEDDGKIEAGTRQVEVQFVASGTEGKFEKTEEIPFETKVEKDSTLKKGEIKVITEGKKGSKKVTYTIKDSKIDDTKTKEEVIEKAEDRVIHVGEGVNDGTHKIEEKEEVPFETEIQFDDSLAPGETKEIQKGEAGEKKRDITLTIEDGNVTKTETGEFTETKAPKNRIIKVGRNTEGKVEHKEELPFKYKVEEVDTLKKGEYKIVTPGKVGTKTTTWTIKNSKVEGEPEVTTDPAEDALIQVGKGTNDGTHEVTEKKNIDYKTITEYDENLDAGQQVVEKEGNPGEQERTNTLVIKDGQVTETKEGEFKTTKEATDRVVKVGTKPVTKVVEKPFNTEYVYDENLEAGKTEEVTPGKNGKVTITTTYDKDQKKVVTSETEEAGQNRVVKIGGKTNGTEKVKEEIPFEVEVRKDPSLKKGEWKYATDDKGNELKGEKGEQEKTLTIVNSKVTETSDPTVTKKAKNAVVLVGEGTNDGTHEITEKKALPFETRIEYDESIEAGKEVVTEGSPGEQERTNTLVIKDGKVTETKEGEFTTTKDPVDKVIKIGVKPIVTEVENGYDTEYEYDDTLEAGKMEEKTPGNNGKTTITTSYDKDQKKLVTKEEKTDSTNRVIRVGIKPIVEKESIPNNTEFNHNPELEAGTKKKIKDGTPGEYTITTTFNKETKMLETKVVKTKEPTNEVWEYGTKTEKEVTNGSVKVKSDLPYKVIIKEDKTMDAGTYKVEQDGEVGEKITTIKIKNSEEESRSEEITKEAKDKIIVVGTKPATCPIPEDPQKPGKKDPQKPGKEDPQKPGKEDPQKPGKEDPQKPGKEDPQKPGKEDPQKPGKEDPQKPGKEDPQKPGKEDPNKPGKEDPEKPSKNTPNKPGENPSVDPKNTPQESPEKPKLEKENDSKVSDAEKAEKVEKVKETEEAKVLNQVKKEEDEEASRVGNEAGKANLAGDDKAPKTGDAGLMAETASAGLASGLLLLLGRFKRKKEDEE